MTAINFKFTDSQTNPSQKMGSYHVFTTIFDRLPKFILETTYPCSFYKKKGGRGGWVWDFLKTTDLGYNSKIIIIIIKLE
jgi:hypothetical protein